MAKRLGFLALLGLAVSAAPAQGQGYGFAGPGYGGFGYPGYGMAGFGNGYGGYGYGLGGYGDPFGGFGNGYGMYGYGYGGYGIPFASLPYPAIGYGGTFLSGPGLFNPLFGLGLSPLGVQSALGEVSLRRASAGVPGIVSGQSPTIVTVPASGSRTYTYRIYRQ